VTPETATTLSLRDSNGNALAAKKYFGLKLLSFETGSGLAFDPALNLAAMYACYSANARNPPP
jgi:hypothetical protein